MPITKMSEQEKPFVPKTAVDLQKMKLEKLMQNPDKPVIIPERPKDKKGHMVPEFVRNVMGSSAGAGSGEFHVYRHLRRKEYARQKFIDEMAQKETLDQAYIKKVEENKRVMEEKTAKKRAKRLRRKEKLKMKKLERKATKETKPKSESDESDASSEEEEHSEDGDANDNAGGLEDSKCVPETEDS